MKPNQPPVPQTHLSETQVAGMLGIPVTTLQIWRHERRVLPFVRVSRTVRYQREAVEKYLADHTVHCA